MPAEWQLMRIPELEAVGHPGLINVCTLEDIVAEKLVATLRPTPTGGHRQQDLFDVASVMSTEAYPLDRRRVAELATAKGACRQYEVSSAAFDSDVRDRLARDYDDLKAITGENFIPFHCAWMKMLDFVREFQA